MARAQISTVISNQKLSWILQILSCFFWVSSFVYPNQTKMHFVQTSLSRAVVGLIGNYIIMTYFKGQVDLRNPQTNYLMSYRSFSNTLYGMLVALLMFYLPMPIIHTISSSSVIFSAAIQHHLYGVHLSKKSQWLILVSVFGVMIQANGEYITQAIWTKNEGGFHRDTQFQHYQNINVIQSILISLFLLVSAFFWSFGLVFVKQIKLAVYQVNVHNNIVLLLVTGVSYCFLRQQNKSQVWTIVNSLALCGFFVFCAQLSFVLSLQLCKSVGIIMILNTFNIGIAYIYSIIRYQQKLDFFSVLGMIVTLFCIFTIISDRYK